MATIVRIKRRITEDPADALLISRKRVKTDESDVETVLRFVGTVKDSTGLTLGRKVLDAIRNDQLKPGSIKEHKVDLKSKIQKETKESSKANRLALVTSFRNDEEMSEAPQDDAVDSGASGGGLQYDVFDIISDGEPDKTTQKEPESAIACNDVAMIREPTDFVYDLYLTEMEEFKERLMDFNFSLDRVSSNPEELVSYQDNSDEYSDGDEDSNDENYFTNDYPDEDSEFEKEHDYYEYDEDYDDNELVRGMERFDLLYVKDDDSD